MVAGLDIVAAVQETHLDLTDKVAASLLGKMVVITPVMVEAAAQAAADSAAVMVVIGVEALLAILTLMVKAAALAVVMVGQ